ncbi:MAG: hypothetical protein IJK26_00965 [Clostridia bacterium]|nr:hypothetical protein [Clostridia bacterium]
MKIVNLGKNSLIIKDIRGNKITVEPDEQADVTEKVANSLKARYNILVIEEKKVVEEVIEEPVVKKSKKKAK